jgi:hypothetical protein
VYTDWTVVLRLLGGETEQMCTTLNQATVPTQPTNIVSSILGSSATYHSHQFSAKELKDYVTAHYDLNH